MVPGSSPGPGADDFYKIKLSNGGQFYFIAGSRTGRENRSGCLVSLLDPRGVGLKKLLESLNLKSTPKLRGGLDPEKGPALPVHSSRNDRVLP